MCIMDIDQGFHKHSKRKIQIQYILESHPVLDQTLVVLELFFNSENQTTFGSGFFKKISKSKNLFIFIFYFHYIL
jgi:hypothetical protein